jgi:hypothetical protein
MKVISPLKTGRLTAILVFAFTIPVFVYFAITPGYSTMSSLNQKVPVEGFIELFIAVGLICIFKLLQKKKQLL